MEAWNDRIRLGRQWSERSSGIANECRDDNSPIGSLGDTCDVRSSSLVGERCDSTDDLSSPDREVTFWMKRPSTPVLGLEWDPQDSSLLDKNIRWAGAAGN